jgi:copper(I)-binding protein
MKPYLAAILLALAVVPGLAVAHGFSISSIEIVHPFLRATPPGAKTGAGYAIIRNNGTEPDRLLAIETEAAERVEFHQSVVEDGIAKMLPIEGGLEIPAGGEYRLGLDGSHAMLINLTAPIGLGQVIEGTLIFEKAGRLDMTFEVEPAGATLESATEGHADGH